MNEMLIFFDLMKTLNSSLETALDRASSAKSATLLCAQLLMANLTTVCFFLLYDERSESRKVLG